MFKIFTSWQINCKRKPSMISLFGHRRNSLLKRVELNCRKMEIYFFSQAQSKICWNVHGSRQEGAGWGGVEINLSNTKSKKKRASERPPPPPHLGKHHHPSLKRKKFWIRACNMYLNQIRLVTFIKNFSAEVVIDIFMIYWDWEFKYWFIFERRSLITAILCKQEDKGTFSY